MTRTELRHYKLKVDGTEIDMTLAEWLAIQALAGNADALNALATVVATAAEINAVADQSANYVEVTDDTTYAILAANSGKIHYLPDFTAACTMALPAAAAGLEYEFVYVGSALDAHGFILDTGDDLNFFLGGVLFIDTNAGEAADEASQVYPDGDSNSTLTAASVGAGTSIKVKCLDGTSWTLMGQVAGETVPAFDDQPA